VVWCGVVWKRSVRVRKVSVPRVSQHSVRVGRGGLMLYISHSLTHSLLYTRELSFHDSNQVKTEE
jgi:hypothetical protein